MKVTASRSIVVQVPDLDIIEEFEDKISDNSIHKHAFAVGIDGNIYELVSFPPNYDRWIVSNAETPVYNDMIFTVKKGRNNGNKRTN